MNKTKHGLKWQYVHKIKNYKYIKPLKAGEVIAAITEMKFGIPDYCSNYLGVCKSL